MRLPDQPPLASLHPSGGGTPDVSAPGGAAPEPDAHASKAARGNLWAIAGFGSSQLLRLGSNLILTRLVAREVIGLVWIVMGVQLAIGLLSDIGVGPSVIQNKRDDPRFVNTAWTLSTIRGAVLWLVSIAVAYPVSLYFREPLLFGLVAVVGLTGLIAGVQSTAVFTLNRNLAIGRVTLLDFGSRLFGSIVTIVWAFFSPTAWALVVGGVLASTAKSIFSHIVLPGQRNRFDWDRSAVRSVFTLGRWVFVSTMLGYLAMQVDVWVFGRLIDKAQLGVYAIAVLLASAPSQLFRQISHQVNFAVYSRAFHAGVELGPVFRQVRLMTLTLAGWMCAGVIAGGPTVVELLYTEEYAAAGWMLQLLTAGAFFNALSSTYEATLLARGESRHTAMANGAKVVAMAILIPVGYLQADFGGAIAGFAASEVARYLVAMWLARPARLGGLGQDALFLGVTIITSAFGYFAVTSVVESPIVEAIAIFFVVTLGWLPLVRDLRRKRG